MISFKKALKSSTVALATSGALVAAASTANANIFSLNTGWQDVSVEYHDDTNSNGTLDVGERLRGIFIIDTAPNQSNSPEDFGVQLTGIFDTTVASVTDDSPMALPGTQFDYTFMPTTGGSFESTYGTGAMVAFYLDDASADFDIGGAACTSVADGGDCETQVTDGSHILTYGFDGSPHEGWIAENANPTPASGTVFEDDVRFAQFWMNLSLLQNNTGLQFLSVACFGSPPAVGPFLTPGLTPVVGNDEPHLPVPGSECDMRASGEVRGSASENTPYDVTDNVNFRLSAIPEPSSVALFGLGLLGLGAVARRRAKKA